LTAQTYQVSVLHLYEKARYANTVAGLFAYWWPEITQERLPEKFTERFPEKCGEIQVQKRA